MLREANLLYTRGDWGQATSLWRQALARDPKLHAARLNLAGHLRAHGAWAAAVALLREGLALHPCSARLWTSFAQSLLAGGQIGPALMAADAALELDAEAAGAWLVRGTALSAQRVMPEAEVALRRAVALDPSDAQAWLNLGNALVTLDRLEEARAHIERAIARDGGMAEAWTSLGFVFLSEHRLAEAVACHDRAIAIRPDFCAAHMNRATALLTAGQEAAGLAAYEWRRRDPAFAHAYWSSDKPEWRGEPIAERTILVFCEQGFGDTIMCARYLPLLDRLGARIVLVCAAPLIPLLRQLPGIVAVVPRAPPGSAMRVAPGSEVPDYDCWIDQMSLLARFPGAPGAGGYLRADPALVEAWRGRLRAGLRVGLVWAGNPGHGNDHRRSMAWEVVAPLLARAGIAWVSLQHGATEVATDGMFAAGDLLGDYAQTAAAIVCLDVVIAVDTSVAHLAGALGRRCWLMLPHTAEWRWGLEGETTRWYASARLFRQKRRRDWAPVVAEIGAALGDLMVASGG